MTTETLTDLKDALARAERDLAASRARFRNVIENNADGILVVDVGGRVRFANRAAAAIFGRPIRSLVGADFGFPLVSGERTEINVIRSPGETVIAEMRVTESEWEGAPCSLASLRDITERRQMERALRESEQRLDSMLQTMVDGMVFVNPEGEIIYANAAAEEILGLYQDEILGRYFHERSWQQIDEHGAPFPADQLPLAVALRERRSVKGLEHAIIAQSGETKWLSVNAAPIVDQDGQLTGAIASFRDITDQKGTEERAKRYAVELKRSNEDLEQFAYAVSHDLQEPVRMVRSYLELLERRVGDDLDAKAAQFIDYAVDGAERMQEMIRALLSLSRVETRGRDFAPTDVGAVLDRTIMALGRVIHETGGEITYDPMPVVMADRVQLSQVFQNLIANALKFHRDGVEPRVHIRGYPPSDSLFPSGSLTRRGEDADSPSGEGWWTFTVTDNGIGIDPDQADRIFQVFQRLHTEEEYRGLGMGLALCKRIIERHGGRIWVESQTGEGSTFAFTLPASKGDRHG